MSSASPDPRSSTIPTARTRRARLLRPVALAASAVVASAGLVAGPVAPSAQAAEPVVRPAQGALFLVGRGYGHGRGMSQWGAYGAAESGLTWSKILDFYYPGTVRQKETASTIRVWVSGDNDRITNVVPAAGLTATVGRTKRVLPVGANHRQWRALASGAGMRVDYLDAKSRWVPYWITSAPTVVFTTRAGLVRIVRPDGALQELRGSVHSNVSAGQVRTVLASTMESYLRSVVPNEMPSSWHLNALSAQSVAARTYAASYRANQRARGAAYDICDSTACQVFDGVARYSASGRLRASGETARADKAIASTAGVVLKTSAAAGAPFVWAEFSASNGGHTVGGGARYQVAKSDPYDGKMANPNTGWVKNVSASTLERSFALGTLTGVQVVGRDGRGTLGGRVREVKLVGTARTVTVSGVKLRQVLGLRSDWFTVVGSPSAATAAVKVARATR